MQWAPHKYLYSILACLLICLLSVLILAVLILVLPEIGRPERERKAREAVLKAHLSLLRSRINMFYIDTKKYPVTLYDLLANDESDVKTAIPQNSYHGPYMDVNNMIIGGLPPNPYAVDQPTGAYSTDWDKHWRYNPQTGEVRSAVGGITHDGTPFSDL